MASLTHRPRGRPPVGYFWKDGCGWVDSETGRPYCAAIRREQFLQKRISYERGRYWDEKTNVRKMRLERSARQPKKRAKVDIAQLKLDDVARSDASETYRPTSKLLFDHDE